MMTGSHRELMVAISSRSSLSDPDILVCNMIAKFKIYWPGGLWWGLFPSIITCRGGVGWKVAANQLPSPLIWSSAAKLLRQI